MIVIAPAVAGDASFLERMFVEAALWRAEWPKTALAALLERPELARYFGDWWRADDVALIAKDAGGNALGAAWFRTFSAHEPGYGYVSDDVPELGLAVERDHRGRGVGAALLAALQLAARQRGHRGLSLSVHAENPARRLYERAGFQRVGGVGEGVTMVLWGGRA